MQLFCNNNSKSGFSNTSRSAEKHVRNIFTFYKSPYSLHNVFLPFYFFKCQRPVFFCPNLRSHGLKNFSGFINIYIKNDIKLFLIKKEKGRLLLFSVIYFFVGFFLGTFFTLSVFLGTFCRPFSYYLCESYFSKNSCYSYLYIVSLFCIRHKQHKTLYFCNAVSFFSNSFYFYIYFVAYFNRCETLSSKISFHILSLLFLQELVLPNSLFLYDLLQDNIYKLML